MHICNTKECSRLHLDDEPLEMMNLHVFNHFDQIIGINVNDVKNYFTKFQSEVDMLMAQFGKVFPKNTHNCMYLYGCQLWDCSRKEVHVGSFYTAWRNAVRFVWTIPHNSHNNILNLICDDIPAEIQLHKRFVKFFHKIVIIVW